MERARRAHERVRSGLPRAVPSRFFQALDGLGHLGHALGQQSRVRRISDVGRDDGGVSAHPVGLQHLGRLRLGQEGLVQALDAAEPQRVVIFISVVGCGTRHSEGDPTKALPGDRVGHLAAQRLEAEPIAVLQEHEPQVGLDGHRGATEHRVEVGSEGLEELGIVEQGVDGFELGGQSQSTSREGVLPTRSAGRLSFSTRWPRSVLVLRVGAIIRSSVRIASISS